MRSTLHVCLIAGMLLLLSAKAAGIPAAGAWEGKTGGRRAVTLQIRDDGAIHGAAIFYITDDDGDGSHNGDALPPVPLENAAWDGRALHFTLTVDGHRLSFVMKITGAGRAELHYSLAGTQREMVIPLAAIR
jgi:hypothetical protein